jgi:TetR/AcrR family transcriptional regulator, regulator of cefoperazone and chloramphenicol sensitivity
MARNASSTRESLIRAGERLFAAQGVDGAQTRDIVRAAGQANDSAVHYHFRSRRGLLLAICGKHVAAMEPPRLGWLAEVAGAGGGGELPTVVEAVVAPTAARLHTEDGRDFLRIVAQLAGYAGVRTHTVPAPLEGTALLRQLELLEACCLDQLPQPVALERIAIGIGALTAALADRARQLDAGADPLLDHDDFVANLVAMLVAAFRAPVPTHRAPARRRTRRARSAAADGRGDTAR